MNRPPLLTFAAGSTPVVLIVLGGGCLVIYRWWIGELPFVAAVGAFLAVSYVVSAAERLSRYRTWKRAWDSMEADPNAAPARRPGPSLFKKTVAAAVLMLITWVAFENRSDPPMLIVFVLFASMLTFGSVVALVRGMRRRRANSAGSSDPLVQVCIKRPLVEVPQLMVAYRRLPAHCWHALNAGKPKSS